MAVISKELFNKIATPDLSCQMVLHPQTDSCLRALLEIALQGAIGASKFFIIFHLLQNVLKWNKSLCIRKQLFLFLRSVMFTTTFVSIFFSSMCLIRNFSTRFHASNVALCGLLGGLSIFVESEEYRSLHTVVYYNMVVEGILRYFYWKNNYSQNVSVETLIFMAMSALLMHLLQARKKTTLTTLWFYCPTYHNVENGNLEKCNHKDSCLKHLWKGFTRYFTMGYAFHFLKSLLKKQRFNLGINELCSKSSLSYGLLFGGYVGIFRMFNCILRAKDKEQKPHHVLLAGLVAGSSYLFKPSLSILSTGIATTLHLMVEYVPHLEEISKTVPLREVVFVLCSGFLFHKRFFFSDSCPKYVKSFLNANTNGQFDRRYKDILKLISKIVVT